MGERNPEANQLEIMVADYQRLKEENAALRRLPAVSRRSAWRCPAAARVEWSMRACAADTSRLFGRATPECKSSGNRSLTVAALLMSCARQHG
jgi:hypothetical protein